jgi:phosphodiesterase/alkaline phosphatase D-like protein
VLFETTQDFENFEVSLALVSRDIHQPPEQKFDQDCQTQSSGIKKFVTKLLSVCDHQELDDVSSQALPLTQDFVITKTIPLVKANRAHVIQFDELKPNSQYKFSFSDPRVDLTNVPQSIIHTQNPEETMTQFAFVSCNYPERMGHRDLWKDLATKITKPKNENERIRLIAHIGDQIYSDDGHECYSNCLSLVQEKGRHNITPTDFDYMCEQYRNMYRSVWSMKNQRLAMANAMNICIGDDHDYADDWGSLPEHWNTKSNEYLVGCAARQVYWEYQRQLLENVPFDDQELLTREFFNKSEGYSLSIHPQVGMLMLDLRAGRSFIRSKDAPLLGNSQWNQIEKDFEEGGKFFDKKVLIIATPVPFVFLGTSTCSVLTKISDYLNDLMDQWSYKDHVPEQRKLLKLMEQWKSNDSERQILIIAGDAHFGWSSEIKDGCGQTLCQQFTASAITNNPPPAIATTVISMLAKMDNKIDADDKKYSFAHSNWCTNQNYGLVELSGLGKDNSPAQISFRHVV